MTVKLYSRTPEGWYVRSEAIPFQFPGGEWHLKLPTQKEIPEYAYVINDQNIMDDIVILGLWANWCRSLNKKAIVKMPYLPAARADRGTPFSGQVYANLINALTLDRVVLFDPHSPIVPTLINNVEIVESARIIKNSVFGKSGYTTYTGIICPDEGAVERANALGQMVRLPVYKAQKVRDFDTGRILDYQPGEVASAPKDGRYLVVDDICDGGGTFKYLAETTGFRREQLSLWVSHGIFSGKAEELNRHFGKVYTTDSVKPINDIGAEVVPIRNYLTEIYFSQKGIRK